MTAGEKKPFLRKRPVLVTKRALIRLGVLGLILLALFLAGYAAMISMPGKSGSFVTRGLVNPGIDVP